MKVLTVILICVMMVLLVGCDVIKPTVAVPYSYDNGGLQYWTCTPAQFTQAKIETKFCQDTTDYFESYCFFQSKVTQCSLTLRGQELVDEFNSQKAK